MRKLAFYLLLQFCLVQVYASEVTIKQISEDGKSAYIVHVGAFPHENNALQLKFKLSSSIKEPITIENQGKGSQYFVNIGPLHDLKLAKSIKKVLLEETKTNPQFAPKKFELPPEPLVKPKENKKLWNLRAADIRAVIAEVSRVTGKNFVIDPRVQGKISIISSTPMSDVELYQVFLSMLQVSGYAAIPSGEVIKIVPNIDAKTISPDSLSRLKHPPRGDDMMVAVVPVHYVPAEQLVPVLRPLMPQWSSVSAYAPSNMLILSGRASKIKQMANIINQVDSSTASGIDMVHLKHALAMDVASTLKDLLKAQSANAGTGHSQTMLAVDDRSNAIILSGTKTERIKLHLLINQLDSENNSSYDSNTQVVYLHYLRAEDLVPILAGIAQANFSGNVGTTIGTITVPVLDSTNPASSIAMGSGPSGSTSSNTTTPPQPQQSPANTNGATPQNTSNAATQNEGGTKPTVQIIAEPNTNSIIINAPVSIIRILRAVISQLDIRPAQLLIEAVVAEVDENSIKDLGVEWGSDQQTGKPLSFRNGFAIINSQTTIQDFQAELFALATQQKANILSTPSVVVLDNRQAKILVGQQVSVTSTTYPNNANGTAVGTPYETFNRVNVALHLYVRPQITQSGGIELQIDQGNDTIAPGSINNTTNPTFNISAIVTSVHVGSGDIVVLGGLIQNTLGENNRKIPVFGDIPGIGRLFQHNITTHEKRVLLVFIRPVILKNEEQAVGISGEKYSDVRRLQLDMVRQEAYNKQNDAMILPPIGRRQLPTPFSRPVGPPVMMTK